MKRPSVTTKKPTQPPVSKGFMLDVRSGALFLGTSERWLRRRVSRRLVPYRKLCGRILFLRSELESFIETLPGVSLDEAKKNLAVRNGVER